MIYLELLWSFCQIGAMSVGGGYAAMPLIQHQVVDVHAGLTMRQGGDVMAIAEMTPGPIAINAATFVGIQVAGLPGALVATFGCVLPSCLIVLALSYAYARWHSLRYMQGVLGGLRPAVVAMIATAGLGVLAMALYGQRAFPADLLGADGVAALIFVLGFVLLRLRKAKPLWVMAGAGALGLLLYAVV